MSGWRQVRAIALLGGWLSGEAVVFGSPALLVWSAGFVAINWLFFVLHEEPGLERRFGDEYRDYKRAVPRWVPRRTPWAPSHHGTPTA